MTLCLKDFNLLLCPQSGLKSNDKGDWFRRLQVRTELLSKAKMVLYIWVLFLILKQALNVAQDLMPRFSCVEPMQSMLPR